MKAILKYKIPEEESEFKHAVKGRDAFLSLWDFAQYLRSEIKYKDHSEEELTLLENIRNNFYETLNGHGIDLDNDLQ